MDKIFKENNWLVNNWGVILLCLLLSLIVWPLFINGYFSHQDDLQVMRIYEMKRCLEDFQIPCRWIPDMGYGNGFPLFNYYSVLPYYIGALFSYLLGLIGAAKLLFFISLVLGPFGIYFLAKELFGKIPGTVAAVLFLFAPYRAVDSYIRGAVAESFALSIIPLVFYFSLKLIKKNSLSSCLGFSLSLGAFLLSHNISILFFLPLLIIWIIYWMMVLRSRDYLGVWGSFLLGFGMSAFFLIPAFLEKNLVQTENLIHLNFDFRGHFISLNQLFFSRFWGYGGVTPGENDNISFQIGWPHWWLVVLSSLLLILRLTKNKFSKIVSFLNFPDKKILFINLIFLSFFIFSIFMTHNQSIFVWKLFPILAYVQFPWRFLALTIFTGSLLGGMVIAFFRGKAQLVLALAVIILTTLLNWPYFKPEKFFPNLTDEQKLSGKLWEDQQKAAILDYLPKTAGLPREKASALPIVISGQANISNFLNRSNSWEFRAQVIKPTRIEMPIFDFPDWEVKINNQASLHDHDNYVGRISFSLPAGNYFVSGHLSNTPIRNIANTLSAVSYLLLLVLIYVKLQPKNK